MKIPLLQCRPIPRYTWLHTCAEAALAISVLGPRLEDEASHHLSLLFLPLCHMQSIGELDGDVCELRRADTPQNPCQET